ncbi:MAG: THxN family PEP-CTERM protein [Pseudomonadota bacterium]
MRVSSRLAAISALTAALLAGPASAATFYVNTMGAWDDPVGGTDVTGEGTGQLSWGEPDGNGGQSGYSFGSGFMFNTVNLGEEFSLGRFAHRNYRINGDSISSVDLTLTFTVMNVGTFNSVINFTHEETENDEPCAYGSPNAHGCADRVTATMNYDESDAFTVGDTDYFFSFIGFFDGSETVNELLTAEQVATTVDMRGVLQVRPAIEPTVDNVIATPLPASFLALLAAIGGLALVRRRA